jgi:hypothetical protein
MQMEKSDIIGICLVAGIILIAIFLARIISRWMFAVWINLASTYPPSTLENGHTIRFTSMTLIGGFLPLRLNQFVQLTSTEQVLQLKVPLMGLPQIQIPKAAISGCIDNSMGPFAKVELNLSNSETSIIFRGRGARFVKEWWNHKTV